MFCEHVKAAQSSSLCIGTNGGVTLRNSVLSTAPFPPTVRAEFEASLINGHTALIQRVSNRSFVSVTAPTSESPLGLIHIRTTPTNSIQCTCHRYKRVRSLAGATTAPKLSKRCSHIYLCLWAILSDESLQQEFNFCDISGGNTPLR